MPTIEVTEHEKMLLFSLRAMIEANNTEQLKAVEETFFAKSKQTLFTKAELAEKWDCSIGTVSKILDDSNVKPCGKRGKKHEFSLKQAVEAKQEHDSASLYQHEVSWRARAMA
ncbi:MarR family transcriptional regulator [Enterococcus sp. LJL120]